MQLTRTRVNKRKLRGLSGGRGDTPESDSDPESEEEDEPRQLEREPPRGRRIRRCLDGHEGRFCNEEDEDEPLSFSQKPVRRFGILFTLAKQYQRHGR